MPDQLPPSAQVEHQLPGRLRLRVSAKRHDPAFFAAVEESLARAPGVLRLRTSPRTGSVVVEHAGEAASIAAFAREQGLFHVSPATAPPAAALVRRTKRAERSGLRLRPLSVAAAGLAGLGAYQAARGQVVGTAVEHLWHAYSARSRLGMPRLAAALLGLGLYRLAVGPVLSSAPTLLFHAVSAWVAGQANGDAAPRPPSQSG